MEARVQKYGQKEMVIPFVQAVSIEINRKLRIVRDDDCDEMLVIELQAEEWHKVTIEK